MRGEFDLYPEELHWCSYSDYRVILQVTRRLGARRVIEFGPGSSTLALIEGGATHIDACEDDDHWLSVYRERLERRFPGVVHLHAYAHDDLLIPAVHGHRYDLALIDGPHDIEERASWIAYAMTLAQYVLVPLETSEGDSLTDLVPEIADVLGRPYERIESGPLAGAYGLVGPAC